MKLIQLNIWGGKLLYRLMDFIAEQQPDFVCMQEVNDLKGPSNSLFATLDEIKDAGGFSYSFMSANFSYRYMQRNCGFGNAILSRLAFESQETIFTNGAHKDDFDLTADDYNVRSLQHAVVSVNGSPLHILNHHGFLVPGSKEGNDQTLTYTRKIANIVDSLEGPVILAGDFNLTPASPSMQVLSERLTDLPAKFDIQNTYTEFNKHRLVCDYIFVNDTVTVQNFHVSEALVSDHKALILDFDI